MANLVHGDLGMSIAENLPVSTVILDRLPVTVQLSVAATLVSLLIALPAGVISALKKDTWMDNLARVFAFAGVALPNFWLGLLAIIVFGVVLQILPIFGYVSVFQDPWEGIRHLVLPAITLGTGLAAIVTRMTRSSLLEVLNMDYITTARSKGVPERTVTWRHALKNALIPIVTIVGLQFGYVLGGSVLTEIVFALPGLGRLMVDSIFKRDYPVVQATVLIYALIFVIVNLVVDLLYASLDPRITYD
jgi:peptide/nickel transport system permease protein